MRHLTPARFLPACLLLALLLLAVSGAATQEANKPRARPTLKDVFLDLPVEATGTWLDIDRGAKVVIRQNGSTVMARYADGYVCRRGDAAPVRAQDSFKASLSTSDRMLTGDRTVCDWRTPANGRTPIGTVIWRPMKLGLSPDGARLAGKVCRASTPTDVEYKALYSRIEVRLRAFIPSPAVGLPGTAKIPHFSIHGGDDRGFAYSNGTDRLFQSIIVTADPAVPRPNLAIPVRDFGYTTQYSNRQGIQNSDPSWWWRLKPGEEPLFKKRQQVTDKNNVVTVSRVDNHTVRVTFAVQAHLKAPEPQETLSPTITARINVEIRQKEGDGEYLYRVQGTHDGFPAYELYLDAAPVYRHDPLVRKQTPASLGGAGWGEWTINIPWTRSASNKPTVAGRAWREYVEQTRQTPAIKLQCPAS